MCRFCARHFEVPQWTLRRVYGLLEPNRCRYNVRHDPARGGPGSVLELGQETKDRRMRVSALLLVVPIKL